MIPWKLLSSTRTPDSENELTLHQRDTEYSIRVNGLELMNSRLSGSEKMMAQFACAKIAHTKNASVLIGGLGMGFTLSAALALLNADADMQVAELVPSVVTWNRDVLGMLAGYPLNDSRVTVFVDDVARVIGRNESVFDAILLDVDNGPDGFTQEGNGILYNLEGLSKIHRALRRNGVLAVWSASPDTGFTRALKRSSFAVVEHQVRAREGNKGSVHTIWIATKTTSA